MIGCTCLWTFLSVQTKTASPWQ